MGLVDDHIGKVKALGWVLGGGLTGLTLVFLIGSSLIEISRNDVFSIIYAVLLALLGGVMFWRVMTTPVHIKTKAFGAAVSLLTLTSGALAIVLDENFNKKLSAHAKVPLYLLLSITLSFVFLYALVEFIISSHRSLTGSESTPDYATLAAAFPLHAATAGFMSVGGFYGFMFGILDMEDYESSGLHYAAYALGVASGGGVAVLHLLRRQTPSTWIAIAQEDDDDEDDGGDADDDAVSV